MITSHQHQWPLERSVIEVFDGLEPLFMEYRSTRILLVKRSMVLCNATVQRFVSDTLRHNRSARICEDCAARPGAEHEGEMLGAGASPESEEPSEPPCIVHWLESYLPRPWAIRIALLTFCTGGRITVHLRAVPLRLISF